MDTLPYAENVARINGIPVGGFVAEVSLRGEEEFEGYV